MDVHRPKITSSLDDDDDDDRKLTHPHSASDNSDHEMSSFDFDHGDDHHANSASKVALRRKHCRICGDVATGFNFTVVTCESCKSFFRRNGRMSTDTWPCAFNSDCVINMGTRRKCRKCRLLKCLAVGMKFESSSLPGNSLSPLESLSPSEHIPHVVRSREHSQHLPLILTGVW